MSVSAAFGSLARAASFVARSLVALLLGLAAVALAALGFVAMLLSHLARLAAGGVQAASGFAPVLARGVCAGVGACGVAWAFEPVWTAYGGDAPALLPAACLLLSPVAYVVERGAGFGGLALAGVVAVGLGVLLPALHPAVRALALVTVIGAAFFHSLSGGYTDEQVST